VKETKRQGRIAHHHADATVPHIVALLGFSFHAAKIGSIFVNSKFWSIFLKIFLQNRMTFNNSIFVDDMLNVGQE
jgi:hypothetical protein